MRALNPDQPHKIETARGEEQHEDATNYEDACGTVDVVVPQHREPECVNLNVYQLVCSCQCVRGLNVSGPRMIM